MLVRLTLVVAGLLLLHTPLISQTTPALEVGSRVWVALDGPRSPFTGVLPSVLRGTLSQLPGDSLIVALENDTGEARVPISAVHSLHLSTGRRSRLQSAFRGIPSGLVQGLLIGALAAQIAEADRPAQTYLVGAGAGALVEAVRGWIAPGERLRRVPLTTIAP